MDAPSEVLQEAVNWNDQRDGNKGRRPGYLGHHDRYSRLKSQDHEIDCLERKKL